MNFHLADTFTDSLSRLTPEEQKLVRATVFTLFENPAHPSLQLHKLDRARDPGFASIRVSLDLRIIIHRQNGSLLVCFVDHHDRAYAWAERRKLTTHPSTGAIQLVEIRETVQEIKIPVYVEEPVRASRPAEMPRKLFAQISEEQLLSYGVPPDWLGDVLAADEDTLLLLADHLPKEAAEALLELATGVEPKARASVPAMSDPFAHPDSQRRFRNVLNSEELARALEFPWEKWIIFLHPDQKALVERNYSGPARVSGSAGTGKTIVALHRAVWLAQSEPDTRILLTTFSDPLAQALHSRLRRLIANQPRLADRIDVAALPALGIRLYEAHFPSPNPPRRLTPELLLPLLGEASAAVAGHKFSLAFLRTEWEQIVDAWQLTSWPEYRDVPRLGRRTRLPENQRKVLWEIFERLRTALAQAQLITEAEIFTRLAAKLPSLRRPPFDRVVVDEAQDLGIAQLRFLATLAGTGPNRLFFAGDLGQRIFEPPFSWKSLGVDVRGRSTTLRVNYRTSHQIRTAADRLLAPEMADVDGITETRKGTVSLFNGPKPTIHLHDSAEAETAFVGGRIRELLDARVTPQSIGVFVRTAQELPRAREVALAAGVEFAILDENLLQGTNRIAIATMHLAKGLEFQHVFVLACDEDVIPSASRIASVTDPGELEEVYHKERHLLYVAVTRARDSLTLSGLSPGSEFLQDLALWGQT